MFLTSRGKTAFSTTQRVDLFLILDISCNNNSRKIFQEQPTPVAEKKSAQ
jgi:hypothetical protein